VKKTKNDFKKMNATAIFFALLNNYAEQLLTS